jgi:ANTAR domain
VAAPSPPWTLYATAPRGWDETEVSALQAYAGVVASLLGAAVRAELKGALAEQLQVALDSRVWSSGPRALMERECLDEQEAFTHLRRAARSSGRKLNDVAREVADGMPFPRVGPGRPRRRSSGPTVRLEVPNPTPEVGLALPQKLLALSPNSFSEGALSGGSWLRGSTSSRPVTAEQSQSHEAKHFAADLRSTHVGPCVSPPAVTRQKI